MIWVWCSPRWPHRETAGEVRRPGDSCLDLASWQGPACYVCRLLSCGPRESSSEGKRVTDEPASPLCIRKSHLELLAERFGQSAMSERSSSLSLQGPDSPEPSLTCCEGGNWDWGSENRVSETMRISQIMSLSVLKYQRKEKVKKAFPKLCYNECLV